MKGPSELVPGLLALQMGLLPRERFLECVLAWLNELDAERVAPQQPARNFEAFLKEALPPDAMEQVEAAREALGEGEAPRIESRLRSEILEMEPPGEVRAWIQRLSERARAGPAFEAQPRERRYVIGAEIARGGLGRVVEARDGHLGREVAIKLVLDASTPDVARRFVREAQLAARLEHPHIVPVYDFDEMRGPAGGKSLYLCMKRIRGRNLREVLKDVTPEEARDAGRYSRARLLKIFQDLCLGVAFAHSRGVIHRDLKPANIMIGDYGETLIVDWGLAKEKGAPEDAPAVPRASEASRAELTMEGQIVGTPAYMAPEQASGRLAEIDERTDIYALGAILYEILTRRAPFDGGTPDEVLDRVRTGNIAAPSIRLRKDSETLATHSPPRPPLEPVTPELDAICLRALAFRREDRFPTVMALHDEVQLFLEGVKERDRRAREARGHVAAGRERIARYRALRADIEAQSREVTSWRAKIRPHEPIPQKKPLWDAEARLQALREERIAAFAQASAEFGRALTVDPGSEDASDGQCELCLDRFLEAEARRDRDEMVLHRNLLATHDRRRAFAARLEAPGRLTIRTFAFGCDCLRPERGPEWRVEIAGDADVPWRDGRARPDLPLQEEDRPVPAIRASGGRWGHTPACKRGEIHGVEVRIARYEEQQRRLVPGPSRVLGTTPLTDCVLPRGAWTCELRHPDFAPARFPVRIDRDVAWAQDVTLYSAGDIPEGFRFMPAGPFIAGGPWARGGEAETRHTADLFAARFPVTFAEYLDYLNDLAAQGGIEEARRRQPRDGDQRWCPEENGRFRLASPGEIPDLAFAPRWAVFSVSWFDALAYAAWKSVREGRVYRLLHEEEWEKASRGADGRGLPYGDDFDATYSHGNLSLAGKATPMDVDAFPLDESPYGIRGLSGGVSTWCFNALEVPHRSWMAARGGTWCNPGDIARAGLRRGHAPTIMSWDRGIRLCAAPEESRDA